MCGRCGDCKQLFEPNERAEKEALRGAKIGEEVIGPVDFAFPLLLLIVIL
jgi:hypothetical protein